MSVFFRGRAASQHESVLYVWTSDADQKDPDFLSVLDADPASPSYGKVIATAPTGSPGNEAHHFGYTANADRSEERRVGKECRSRECGWRYEKKLWR